MRHLLEIMGGTVGRSVQHKLKSLNIWEGPFAEIQTELVSGFSLCEHWCEMCSEMTSLWKDHQGHPGGRSWSGSAYRDEFVFNLGNRLKQIVKLRETHEEFNLLLSGKLHGVRNDEDGTRVVEDVMPFKYFVGINPILYNRHTNPNWLQIRAEIMFYTREILNA